MIVINDYPAYLVLDTHYALRGDLEGTGDGATSRIAAFLSRNILAFLHLLSCTSRMLPSELCSSPSSINYSDPVPATVVAGAANRSNSRARGHAGFLLTGSYHTFPRVDSVGEQRCITPLESGTSHSLYMK